MDFLIENEKLIAIVLAVIVLIASYRWVLWLFGVIIVPDDSIGIVTKKFALFGSSTRLADGHILALKGEAGYQADTLAPGLHWALWPWQYAVTTEKFVAIPVGKVGLVEACDGQPLPSGRIVAKRVECTAFQNARAFLEGGGQRGPQIDVVPPGSYRINPLLFNVRLVDAVNVAQGQIGILEARDGQPLASGRVIAKQVACDSFQDGAAFLANGGERGPQMGIMSAGTFRINTLMFDVKPAPVLDIPENKIGIVTTREGQALANGVIAGPEVAGHSMFQSPEAFVANGGFKGLQEQVLLAGRYFINPLFATVEIVDMVEVPIAHVGVVIAFVGKEGRDVTGDTFRHGNLVSKGEKGVWVEPLEVLEPTIGNYFRNAAQGSDIIDFLRNRTKRQGEARDAISAALQEYNVGAVDTLIGDIVPPDELMKTLTDRKIAEQEQVTYETQRKAQEIRQTLKQATALADTQATVVDAERQVSIAEFKAKAAVANAEGEAKAKTINAQADATVTRTVGDATAERTRAIGTAEADVITQKIKSYGAGNYAVVQVAEALSHAGVKLVPDIVAGGDGAGGGSLVNVLLGTMLRDMVTAKAGNTGPAKDQ